MLETQICVSVTNPPKRGIHIQGSQQLIQSTALINTHSISGLCVSNRFDCVTDVAHIERDNKRLCHSTQIPKKVARISQAHAHALITVEIYAYHIEDTGAARSVNIRVQIFPISYKRCRATRSEMLPPHAFAHPKKLRS
jgi:hypothetical protein